MNDLITIDQGQLAKYAKLPKNKRPALYNALSDLLQFEALDSWAAIQRECFEGLGLSPHTKKNYLTAARQFYDFTGGLHPGQVTPADIELWYDSLLKGGIARNTARLKIAGLKKYFLRLEEIYPSLCASPFRTMTDKLTRKLSKTKKNGTQKALTGAELNTLLNYLSKYHTLRDRGTYAAIFTLATSGLRAAELLQLHWKDLEQIDGVWYASFIQKGGDSAQQELYAPAVDVCSRAFKAQHGRKPNPEDALFWTVPSFNGDGIHPMSYNCLLQRIRSAGVEITEKGLINRAFIWSPHLFRRTYATILYKSGMGLKAVQLLTRHASVETLAKHYIDDQESPAPYLSKALQGI